MSLFLLRPNFPGRTQNIRVVQGALWARSRTRPSPAIFQTSTQPPQTPRLFRGARRTATPRLVAAQILVAEQTPITSVVQGVARRPQRPTISSSHSYNAPFFSAGGVTPRLTRGALRVLVRPQVPASHVLIPALTPISRRLAGARRLASTWNRPSHLIIPPTAVGVAVVAVVNQGFRRRASLRRPASNVYQTSTQPAQTPVVFRGPVRTATLRRLVSQILVAAQTPVSSLARGAVRRLQWPPISASRSYSVPFYSAGGVTPRLTRGVVRRLQRPQLPSSFLVVPPPFTNGGASPSVASGEQKSRPSGFGTSRLFVGRLNPTTPRLQGLRRLASTRSRPSHLVTPPTSTAIVIMPVTIRGIRRLASRSRARPIFFQTATSLAVTPVLVQGVVRRLVRPPLAASRVLIASLTQVGFMPSVTFTQLFAPHGPPIRPQIFSAPYLASGVPPMLYYAERRVPIARSRSRWILPPVAGVKINPLVSQGAIWSRPTRVSPRLTPTPAPLGITPPRVLFGARWLRARSRPAAAIFQTTAQPPITPVITIVGPGQTIARLATPWRRPPRIFTPPATPLFLVSVVVRAAFRAPTIAPFRASIFNQAYTASGVPPMVYYAERRLAAKPLRPRFLVALTSASVAATTQGRTWATQRSHRPQLFTPAYNGGGIPPRVTKGVPRRLVRPTVSASHGLVAPPPPPPRILRAAHWAPVSPGRPQHFTPPFTGSGIRPTTTQARTWPAQRRRPPQRVVSPAFTASGFTPTITQGRAWPVQRRRPPQRFSPPFTASGATPITHRVQWRPATLPGRPRIFVAKTNPAAIVVRGRRWASVSRAHSSRFTPILFAPFGILVAARVRSGQALASVRASGISAARMRSGNVLMPVRASGRMLAWLRASRAQEPVR